MTPAVFGLETCIFPAGWDALADRLILDHALKESCTCQAEKIGGGMKPVEGLGRRVMPRKDRAVFELLRRGGWQTAEELSLASRRDMVAVLDDLDSPANRGGVLMVRSPAPGADAMFHVVTPSTANLPKMPSVVSVTRLPWQLKKSALAKAVSLFQNGSTDQGVPDLVMSAVALEERLVEMDLRTMRRRPREGFQYPCSWNFGYDYDTKAASNGRLSTGINPCITFVGMVSTKHFLMSGATLNESRFPGVQIVDDHPGLMIIVSAAGATIRLNGILPVSISGSSLKPVEPPTRGEIIAETRSRILDAAEKLESVRPFTPVRGFTFKLL